MPFITVNGQLQEVSQEEYDIYTIGQKTNPAAGGDVVQLNNTQTILIPNTTNNTPGQSLPTQQEQLNELARLQGVDPNAPLTAEQQAIVDAANNSRRTNTAVPQTPAEAARAVAAAEEELVQEIDPAPLTPEEIAYLNDPNANTKDLVENGTPELLTDAEAAYLASPNAATRQNVQNQMAGEPGGYFGTAYDDEGNLNPGWSLDEDNNPVYVGTNTSDGTLFVDPATGALAEANRNAAITQGFKEQARVQQTIAQQRKNVNNQDWRVRLRLAPQASYLYNAPNPGILQPLKTTDGIIFPYTPSIDTQYRVNYDTYDLTHSNYRGYFYKNSFVDAVNLRCTFTAQSSAEANYLLATIHFLKSVTKMFYGQDAERGAPPPLVYLSGLGQYQFNEHPCLVSAFNYNLPADVDYVRAGSPNNNNTNLSWARSLQSAATNSLFAAVNRLKNAGGVKGGINTPPPPPTLGVDRPTYVPTKMEISISLLPIQSRQQVSKQFSVKGFASGDLLKGGFW